MSGVPTPQYPIVEVFGKNAVIPADITLPIPIPSQIDILPGAASFTDGFPSTTRIQPESGGAYAYGQDITGILSMLSQYARTAQAGQLIPFSGVAAAYFGGYAVGARVSSVVVSGLTWTNWQDGNAHDPDVDPTGWAASYPISVTVAPAAGTYDNYVLPGCSDYALDINSAAGPIDFTGFIAQRPGQRLLLSCVGVGFTRVLANAGGSGANNRVRAQGDLGIDVNQTLVLQYVPGLNRWLAL